MVSIDEAYDYVKGCLDDKRFLHTLGVISVAKKLAIANGISEEKAEIAALCHDIAKYTKVDESLRLFKENNIILSMEEENTKELWHSILAPIVSREKLGIEDKEILDAMRWHTTGRENMTTLEKIIYISDMIEPSRVFPGVEEIREATIKDLNKGVLLGLNHSITYLINQGAMIDINSIKARNYLVSLRG